MPTLAESIREYTRTEIIEPARRKGDTTVSIRVGDLHRRMGLLARVPAVCQALTTQSFLQSNRVVIEKKDGPPSGQGTNVTFVFRLMAGESSPPDEDKWERLLSLRGAGKDFFARLGGAEKVVQEERAAFRDLDSIG